MLDRYFSNEEAACFLKVYEYIDLNRDTAPPTGYHQQELYDSCATSFPFNVFRQMLRKSHELGLLTGMKEVVLSLEEEIVFKHIKALDMPSSVSRGE